MNVEVGTEAAQFPEKEYINGIFIAVGVPFTEQNSFFLLALWISPGYKKNIGPCPPPTPQSDDSFCIQRIKKT